MSIPDGPVSASRDLTLIPNRYGHDRPMVGTGTGDFAVVRAAV